MCTFDRINKKFETNLKLLSFNFCDRTIKVEKNCFEINNVNCCNCFEIDENKKFDLCDIERENKLLNKLMNSMLKSCFSSMKNLKLFAKKNEV